MITVGLARKIDSDSNKGTFPENGHLFNNFMNKLFIVQIIRWERELKVIIY